MNRRSFLKSCAAGLAAASVPLSLVGAAAKAKANVVAKGIPYISLLQPLSPKVGYPGIAAGMLLNTQTGKVFNSIEFVPCRTEHVFVEWKDRNKGGKMVGSHRQDSDIVKTAKQESTQFGHYVTPDGNTLVETFYLYGLQVNGDKVVTRCVLGFTGAKITEYRNFLKIVMSADTHVPLFAHRLRISSVPVANRHGIWFNYFIEPAKGRWSWDWSRTGVDGLAMQRYDVAGTLTPPDHPFIEAGHKFACHLREKDNEQA